MMFIFSSTHYELFKQNILNACCYPAGHLMRVRYEEKYVPTCLGAKPQNSLVGKTGVFVYAEGAEKNKEPGDHPNLDYRFYPIRRCKIKHAQNVAGIIMLDLELLDFVDYGEDNSLEDDWDASIKRHKNRPFLKAPGNATSVSTGFYVYGSDDLPGLDISRTDEQAWRSVIDRVNRTELASCVTYRVTGFFRMNDWLGIWRLKPESRITPSLARPDPIYPFRTGETILMKLFFYGQANKDAKDKVLKLKFDTKTFTSASKENLPIDGRYNEERILLPTVRGTDSVMSALSITQGDAGNTDGIWAPQPSFVISVRPPWFLVAGIVVSFTIAFLLASVSKFEDLSFLRCIPGSAFLTTCLNPFPRVFGAFFFLCASWQYLRKFPLK
jgi:hypothetical protein